LGGAIEIMGGGGGGNVDDDELGNVRDVGYVDVLDASPSALVFVIMEGGLFARVEVVATGVNLIFNPDFGGGTTDELLPGRISGIVPPVDVELCGLSLTFSLPGLEASGLNVDATDGGGIPEETGDAKAGGIMEPPAANAANEGGGASGTT
jgi:hypothetical protein